MSTFRIGTGAGFSSDRLEPAVDLVGRGELDAVVLECLGERTVAFGHRDRMADPSRGYNSLLDRRMRALLLVPIVLVPLSLATLVLVFGRQIEAWMIDNAVHELRHVVLFLWRMARWAVALVTSVSVLGALYHFGTHRKEHWAWVGPGALAATLLWFPATLAFGWYVTRIADYSMFYGSFGAGIATLVWLYIASFSALLGAELNGVLYRERQKRASASASANRDSSTQ